MVNQIKPNIRLLLLGLDFMRISCIYASILGLLKILGYWSVDELKKTWEKSWQNKYNNQNTIKYYHYRAFNSSSINYLFKSLAKLQSLVQSNKNIKIGLQFQQDSKSNSIKKIVIFVITIVEYKIIK